MCAACYGEGRFPSSLHSGEFVKLEMGPYEHAPGTVWTDQETLRLLEGLEMFEDEWDKVSDHVRTRTKDECVVKFLQLPIEDPFLEATQAELGPLQYAKMPFTREDNPILSVMAFLASAVDKNVAAQAAGRSIAQLESGLKARAASEAHAPTANGTASPVTNGDSSKEAAATNGSTPAADEMDVDPATDAKPAGVTSANDDGATSSARNNVEQAAVVALGAAAAKAHLLALEEDASLHSLVTSVVEAQVRKIELKLSHFDALESLLEVERRTLEQGKQQLYEDRLKVARMMQDVQALLAKAKADPAGVAEAEVDEVAGGLGVKGGEAVEVAPEEVKGPTEEEVAEYAPMA